MISLRDNPNALKAKKSLSDISSGDQDRPGSVWYLFGGILVGLAGMFFTIIFTASLNTSQWVWPFFIAIAISWLPLIVIFMNREQILISQNQAENFSTYLKTYLNSGERILCIFDAKIHALEVPEWISENTANYGYFVFTDERLVIVCIARDRVGLKSYNYHIQNGDTEEIVENMYTCDFTESNNFSVSSFRYNPFFIFTHKKFKVKPVSCRDKLEWSVACKTVKKSRILDEILKRLVDL